MWLFKWANVFSTNDTPLILVVVDSSTVEDFWSGDILRESRKRNVRSLRTGQTTATL